MQQDKLCYTAFNADPSTPRPLLHIQSIDKWNSRLSVPEGQHCFWRDVEATLLNLNFSCQPFFFLFQLFLCWQGSAAFAKLPARINVTVQSKICLSPPYQAPHHIHPNQLCNPKVGFQWKPTSEADIRIPSLYYHLPYVCLVAITALASVRNTFSGKTAFLKKSLLYSENFLCKFTLWLFLELLIFCAMQQ